MWNFFRFRPFVFQERGNWRGRDMRRQFETALWPKMYFYWKTTGIIFSRPLAFRKKQNSFRLFTLMLEKFLQIKEKWIIACGQCVSIFKVLKNITTIKCNKRMNYYKLLRIMHYFWYVYIYIMYIIYKYINNKLIFMQNIYFIWYIFIKVL